MTDSFRSLFNYPSQLTYLNSGSVSLTPNSVLTKVQEEKSLMEKNPTAALFGAWERMWKTQKELALFVHADPRHLYLRSNVTIVMNDFLLALRLPPESEILISDLEYGAIVRMCEYKAKIEGHTLRVVSLFDQGEDPSKLTEEQIVSNVSKSLGPKTKLVMMSHVMTGNGLVLPIEKLASLFRSKNILFAVDGAHGAGALPLDFSQSKVDFYGSNLHKWVMGPKGTGFGYVSPSVRDLLEPQFAGWTTGKVLPHFAVFGEGDPWTARWMICSTHNFSDFYGLDETFRFWHQQGSGKINQQIAALSMLTEKLVTEKTGWKCLSAFPDSLRGPLTAFELPPKLAELEMDLMRKMYYDHKIVISMTHIQGDWCLRLSPHIYNSEEEISQVAQVLSEL